MAYFAPYLDESGLHLPTYPDMMTDMISQAQNIFGQDIYLAPDSQDYQLTSIMMLKMYDTMQALQLAYNSRGPNTAIGSALDGVVKINGINRKGATNSTCVVTLTGTPSTAINSGIVADVSGNYWNLPANIVIPQSGSIDVTATAQATGNINAGIGDINTIITPTAGWTGVTNNSKAIAGNIAETDMSLRTRQVISTAQPSKSILEGLKGAIASVTGVTRSLVLENDTGSTDGNNLPPHSIAAIVEGGANSDIAQTLFLKKSPGCYTAGSTSVNVTDSYGQSNSIRFYRPSYVDIDIAVTVKAMSGYTTETTAQIQQVIANFLNEMGIGEEIYLSFLFGAAILINLQVGQALFSISALTAAKHGNTKGTADILLAFNEVARGNASYIAVTVT